MSEENLEVPFEFGECHAHIFMDGKNYKKAVERHKNGVDESVIRSHFACYQTQGIHFVRDGGDALGVSRRAKELAPEYGIDYRTPIFAIHKNGHYGKIVGKGFDTLKEYTALVKEVKTQGGDFIKIMTTGIMDFDTDGGITGEALRAQEVKDCSRRGICCDVSYKRYKSSGGTHRSRSRQCGTWKLYGGADNKESG